jgi:hypothetical protein
MNGASVGAHLPPGLTEEDGTTQPPPLFVSTARGSAVNPLDALDRGPDFID